ncbi:MAG: PLDc N-terminal domain-containing protein [Longimicrobiales bacterium]
MSIRLGLALVVLALDLWALNQLHAQRLARRERIRWTLAIVILPIVGILLWRRSAKRQRIDPGALSLRH